MRSVAALDPAEAAARLIEERAGEDNWLDAFASELDRRRSAESLARVLRVWGLNQSAAAALFGVSRQALSKWLDQGVPFERVEAVADLAAATDLLTRYIKRDRIPAVVRRGAAALGGASLLDLLKVGDIRVVLRSCQKMFSFADANT